MRSFGLFTATLTAAALLAYAPPAASWGPGHNDRDGGVCSPDASLLGFTDALDKSSYDGTQVSGLSALAGTRHHRALALVDNVGTTPARFYEMRIGTWWGLDAEIRDVTTLTRPDGVPYTGADFDGEGLVVERGGRTILASSETEPSIRRFRRFDGRQIAEFEVPERFRVAPDGQAASNATFESLTVTRDGRALYAGMEGPLESDGTDADGHGLHRILRYDGHRHGWHGKRDYEPASQIAYRTDPGLGLVELVALSDGQLLALERGWESGVGNTVRIYQVTTADAPDVTGVESLQNADALTFAGKELLVDLADCPPMGAEARQPQPNPLLDNVEAMMLGKRLGRDRHELFLLSDDNSNPTQITRLYRLSVDLPGKRH